MPRCRTRSTLNFASSADDIPTFSLADLLACVEKDDKDFFRRHFDSEEIVLIGTVLDVEDRKIHVQAFRHRARRVRARGAVRWRRRRSHLDVHPRLDRRRALPSTPRR